MDLLNANVRGRGLLVTDNRGLFAGHRGLFTGNRGFFCQMDFFVLTTDNRGLFTTGSRGLFCIGSYSKRELFTTGSGEVYRDYKHGDIAQLTINWRKFVMLPA